MYIRDRFSSATRPHEGAERLPPHLRSKPGETRTVAFDITPELLAFYDANMKFIVEPGEFEIMVGTSSRDADLQTVVLAVQ